jgi:hypothetical protein
MNVSAEQQTRLPHAAKVLVRLPTAVVKAVAVLLAVLGGSSSCLRSMRLPTSSSSVSS